MTNLLTRDDTRGGADGVLRVRGPAYGFMAECLRLQGDARRQSRIARFFGANPLCSGAREWYRDAQSDVRNAKRLKGLGDGFTLLHATHDEDIAVDHLVIGPTGAFTIATKNHSGYRIRVENDVLSVNTRRTHHVRDARFEAARATKLLDPKASGQVTVIPLIAIVDPRSLAFGHPRPTDVVVVASSRLARTITRRKRALTDEAIAELVVRAQQGGRWHADSRVVDDTFTPEADFALLVQRVDAAARRRALWILGGLGAVLAGIAVAALLFGAG